MTTELLLTKTSASGLLLPARLTSALALLAKVPGSPRAPRGAMFGQELRLVSTLAPEDPAASGFLLEFGAQGARLRGTAHGPSAALLTWAFHALAAQCRAGLEDVADELAVEPRPELHRARALAYLEQYEREVLAHRTSRTSDARTFLDWLAREEHVALAEGDAVGALAASLPMQDASSLYEALLSSDAVEDVFVSESEIASLLRRFAARAHPER